MKRRAVIKSYNAIFEPATEGGFNVSFPDVPGCVTFGETFEEARQMAKEVLELWLEELAAHGDELPRPSLYPVMVDLVVARTPSYRRSSVKKYASVHR